MILLGRRIEQMKLWELIVKLEELEQQGKRDYKVKVMFWSDEASINRDGIWTNDDDKTIYL